MAELITFHIRNGKELEQKLLKLGYAVSRKMADKALEKAIAPVLDAARRLVPIRTGALLRGISSNPDPQHGPEERAVLIGVIPPVSSRAHFTEFGTAHNAAQPFIRPAMDGEAARAIGVLGARLGEMIEAEADRNYKAS